MPDINLYGFDCSQLKTYSGFFHDEVKLKASASGGAVTFLSEKMIEAGGKVIGVAYTPDFSGAEFFCATSVSELDKLKGSKYIVSRKEMLVNGEYVPVFHAVGDMLVNGETVLFIGLGCDVAAMKKYVLSNHIDDSRLYTVDLICHGPTVPEVHRQFVAALESRYRSKVISFNVRNKKKGWTPPYIRAEFANSRVYEAPLFSTDYGYAFGAFSKESCYSCQFRALEHPADITAGDYWGLTEEMDGYNPNGVSILFSRSEKGDRMIALLQNDVSFALRLADTAHALNGNPLFYRCRPKPAGYEKFKHNLTTKGLRYAVRHNETLRQRLKKKFPVKRIIKNILSPLLKKPS